MMPLSSQSPVILCKDRSDTISDISGKFSGGV